MIRFIISLSSVRRTLLFLAATSLWATVVSSAAVPRVWAQERLSETIAAVVNDEPITRREVNERLGLVLASSSLPATDEIKSRLVPQIIDQLIEEQLKLQEAKRQRIDVSDEAVKKGISSVAAQNNMSYEAFVAMLSSKNVKLRTLRRQVRAQIAWSQVIAKEIRPRVSVTDRDVAAELARLENNIGKTEYLLAEIFLPVTQNNPADKVEAFAHSLVNQMIEEKIPFPEAARQFSQSAAAARGGDLGWVEETQLPEELEEALRTMESGSLSRPLKTLSGYHILLVRDKREISPDVLPDENQIRERLGYERLERQQRRLILDLKAASFIDVRV